MGNYKFRLSDMIPNAWFYKLRDMSSVRNHNHHHHQYPTTTTKKKQLLPSPTTSNYHYKSPTNSKALDTHFLEPPRKSSNPPKGTTTTIRKTIYYKQQQQSPNSITSNNNNNCSEDLLFSQSPIPNTNILNDDDDCDHDHEYFSCRVSASTTDIIIDMNQSFSSYSTKIQKKPDEDWFGTISEQLDHLPPILTKVPDPDFDHHRQETLKDAKRSVIHKQPASGVKLKRSNSPRIAGGGGGGRRSVSKKLQRRKKGVLKGTGGTGGCSVAIVKSSLDPQTDFMESMMEMIVENNIRGPKALEDLLACYLSLNSADYHPLIVKAFQHIWLHLPHLQK